MPLLKKNSVTAPAVHDGVVITLADVTRLKQIEGGLEFQRRYAENIVESGIL